MAAVPHFARSLRSRFYLNIFFSLFDSVALLQKEVFISILMILRRVPGNNGLYVVRFFSSIFCRLFCILHY